MVVDLLNVALGGFLASLAWFIVGGVFYASPPVSKIHKRFAKAVGMRQWKSGNRMLAYTYLMILVHCLLFALAYALVKPALPGDVIARGLAFGVVLVAVSSIPSVSSRLMLTTYPRQLIFVDLAGGWIGSLLIGLVLALVV
jgi:hypothetical protein